MQSPAFLHSMCQQDLPAREKTNSQCQVGSRCEVGLDRPGSGPQEDAGGCQGPGRKVRGSASTARPPSSSVKAALGDLPEARPATVARPPSAQTYRLKDARPSPSWSAPHVRAARSALWETECSAGRAPRLPRLQNYNSHKALGRHSRRLSGGVALCACARPSTLRPGSWVRLGSGPGNDGICWGTKTGIDQEEQEEEGPGLQFPECSTTNRQPGRLPVVPAPPAGNRENSGRPRQEVHHLVWRTNAVPALPVMTGSRNCRSSWASSMQRGGAPRDPTVPLRPDAEAVPARDEDAGSWPLGHG
ncbi:uncharacterized protein LOC112605666 [Theropithecus gelada]|uniref:uncharacterized protein LOC112605666 n=1 Tax=Theropithecus gelada TaxID=9565 RepID=UPI000DC1A633|nr:uncharacterized protein LOC112605666 [Theropithecus gelada]